MKKGIATRSVVKPEMWKLNIPDLEASDQRINDYTWIDASDLTECVNIALKTFDPTWSAEGYSYPPLIFNRYSLLNHLESYVTWVAIEGRQTNVTILGEPPSVDMFQKAICGVYMPARWGLNILKLAQQGVVTVTRDTCTLIAHMTNGTRCRILISGIDSSNYSFELAPC